MRYEAIAKTEPARFVVVHYHIFKNGGSTIESILEREFHGRFASFHGSSSEATLHGGQLAELLAGNPALAAVTSHHICYPNPDVAGFVFFDCCFLRHPFARLHSVYTYLRKIESTDWLCLLAHRNGPADFVRILMDQAPHLVSDVQVQRLANSGAFRRFANQADLARAMQILSGMAIPGVVEMFDESLVVAEYCLAPAFPGIQLHYVPQNVSGGPQLDAASHQEKWSRLWGISVYDELTRLNEFDLELHAQAEREIAKRLSRVPRAQKKLAAFRGRCRIQQAEDRRVYA